MSSTADSILKSLVLLMSGYSLLLVSAAFITFAGDWLPGSEQLKEVPGRLSRVPAYVRGEIQPDLVSLYWEGGAVGRQAMAVPSLARSMRRQIHAGGRLLCAEARAEADQLGRRFSTSGETLNSSQSDEVNPENPPARRAVVVRPSGMDAGVTANERSVVHDQSVRVR
jgi:hypothetical protein